MEGQRVVESSDVVWTSYSHFHNTLINEDSSVFEQLNDMGGGFDEDDIFPNDLFLIKDLWRLGKYHRKALDGGSDY